MNEFIELFTEERLSRPYHENTPPPHVFHKMMEYYGDRLSKTDRGLLSMQFENLEYALGFSRRRELQAADLLFKLIAEQMDYPELVRNGMLSMVKATLAYYVYACGRHEEAVELLEQAIYYSMSQSMDFPFMLTGSQQQWLNIAVVRSRQGDLDAALSELKAMTSFFLTGEASGMGVEERFHFDGGGVIGDRFWQVEPDVHHFMWSNIAGNAFGGILGFCNNDFALAGNYFGELIRQAACAMQGRRVIQWARAPILLLHLFYTGQRERFLKGISEQFDEIRQAAPGLQWLIISNYVLLFREAGFDLKSHPNYKRLFEVYSGLKFNTDLLKPAVHEMG